VIQRDDNGHSVMLPDLPVSLLGQSWLRQISNVEIRNDEVRLK